MGSSFPTTRWHIVIYFVLSRGCRDIVGNDDSGQYIEVDTARAETFSNRQDPEHAGIEYSVKKCFLLSYAADDPCVEEICPRIESGNEAKFDMSDSVGRYI